MKPTSTADLSTLLARLAEVRIGVVGDFALDCYWQVVPDAATTSVETGKATRPVSEQRYAPGAAGNVAVNLRALKCGTVKPFGVIGNDPWGHALRRLMQAQGIDDSGLIEQDEGWSTNAYVKPLVKGVEQARIDFGDFNELSARSSDRLLDRLSQAMPRLDILVINAQARSGIHTERLRRGLAGLIAASEGCRFIVDSRDSEGLYEGCALKINDFEAARHCGLPHGEEGVARSDLLTAAETLYARQGHPLFITRGAEGILVYDDAGATEIPAPCCCGEIDTVGAGDAALAGIAAATAAGATPCDAAVVGNLAAGVSIRKVRQTGSATPEEILSLYGTEAHFDEGSRVSVSE